MDLIIEDSAIFTATNDKILVDAEDFEELLKYKWQTQSCKSKKKYAQAWLRIAAYKFKAIYMHRLLMNAKQGETVDHINGDTFDNRKANLRVCSQSNNGMNRKKSSNLTSSFKGVYKRNRPRAFMASIKANGRYINLGSFYTEEEAAKAYNEAATKYFGEYACLNQI